MMKNGYTIVPTRFPELGYTKVAPGLWRCVDITSLAEYQFVPFVGPHYRTKAELLADLERYHAACWRS